MKPDTTKNILTCNKCGAPVGEGYLFCGNCGEKLNEENVAVDSKTIVKVTDFDPMYQKGEDALLIDFISKELEKANFYDSSLIPADIIKRKKIMSIIMAILRFVYICLIFFHFPPSTYVIGLIILIIIEVLTNKYDFMNYLVKEIKSRPSEKISNIVMNVKNSCVVDNTKTLRIGMFVISLILPLIIFSSPRIMYESVDEGYAVRFYTYSLSNFKTAKIPATHNGKNVVSLRGNTFSNMYFLESVELPDTVREIRGQAFKNCSNLTSVNIPSKLEYLGGGAFANSAITSVELPDTLTTLGGESFSNCSDLISVKLSKNLTEIRGNTFENCVSLKNITIPDKVTRIGGHAFNGDYSLLEVNISENSQLTEIGSSAFRDCDALYSITIPDNTYVNERAFKNSPTNVKTFSQLN